MLVVYTPNSGFIGSDQFTFSVVYPEGVASADALVTIAINEVPSPKLTLKLKSHFLKTMVIT